MHVFIHVYSGIKIINDLSLNGQTEYKTKSFLINGGIKPSLSFNLTDKLLLEASFIDLGFGYNDVKEKYNYSNNDVKSKDINVYLNINNIALGLTYKY